MQVLSDKKFLLTFSAKVVFFYGAMKQSARVNKKNLKAMNCWVVSEGMAGTQNQCIAVAEALGVACDVKTITLRQPWKMLSPYIGFECAATFSPALNPPWPDLVIASGRKAIAASRYIKRMSGGQSFTVQIQDPRIDPENFDLVAIPHHDPTRGDNVIITDASPNRITDALLGEAASAFPAFTSLPAPRIAVLIGGSSKAYTMSEAVTRRLAAQLKALDGSLMITPSRRTGATNEAILRDTLPDAFIWDSAGENPYFGMLAAADFILVTADSASMISDACTTGKPVYMIDLEGGHPRIDKLHKHLIDRGVLRVFEGRLDRYTYEPLRDAQKIAADIIERMAL